MLNFFRIIGFLEGLSFIGLLFVGVPMKYIYNNEVLVKTLGMPHGILFLLYISLTVMLKNDQNWNNKQFLTIGFASLIPFGTFYTDKKYLKN